MIVLGFDYSSKCTGIVELTNDIMTDQAVWKPPPKTTRPAALLDYEHSLADWIGDRPADLAMVEDPKVKRGYKTVRALSHFEAITYLVLERRKIPIRTAQPGVARQIVLGLAVTTPKEQVLEAVRTQFPGLRFPPINQGGGDVADAFVQAKAASEILRRNG